MQETLVQFLDWNDLLENRYALVADICYPLQYSWVSLMAQLVKSLPAMWDIWVQSLDWEDPLEKEKITHCSIL